MPQAPCRLPPIETEQSSNSGEGEAKWCFGGWLVSERYFFIVRRYVTGVD